MHYTSRVEIYLKKIYNIYKYKLFLCKNKKDLYKNEQKEKINYFK